jgi:DtxR family Mn-dependent transcriptional regulator
MLSESVEDYLRAIYELGRERESVTTGVLAERIGVAPASVTGMLKRLAEAGYLAHEPYRGTVLTETGRRLALEVLRHHRLIERYLAEALGVPWDQVHAEAHRWEHVLSEDLEDRMDATLGYPATDPHGSPIPARDGSIAELPIKRLADLAPAQSAVIAEVRDGDPELLRYLGGLGLYPGVEVTVIARAPLDGPWTIDVAGDRHFVGHAVATNVFVREPVSDPAQTE